MPTSARPGRPPLSLESLERVGASARRRCPRQGATCSSTSPLRSARSRSARPSSSAAAYRASRVSPVHRAMQTRRGNDGCARLFLRVFDLGSARVDLVEYFTVLSRRLLIFSFFTSEYIYIYNRVSRCVLPCSAAHPACSGQLWSLELSSVTRECGVSQSLVCVRVCPTRNG